MSFYSYKNSGSTHCPCNLSGNEVFSGLNEKICIQVQRVYDSCLMQEQLKEKIIMAFLIVFFLITLEKSVLLLLHMVILIIKDYYQLSSVKASQVLFSHILQQQI